MRKSFWLNGLPRVVLACLALCLLTAPSFATEWPKTDIPPDPAIRLGVLANGMRYAILKNGTPSGSQKTFSGQPPWPVIPCTACM